MPRLIKDGVITEDNWLPVEADAETAPPDADDYADPDDSDTSDHLAHTSHASWHDGHQYGGWVRGLPAWHVDADPIQRQHALAELAAVLIDIREAVINLPLVIGTDTLGGGLERALDARAVGLALPADEGCSIIFERNLES